MARIWKFVLAAALVLLVCGVILAGTGLLTGASPERVWTGLNGWDGLKASAESVWNSFLALFR